MDALLAAIEGTGIAQTLRMSRWGYAAVNAAHIFGFALLVGSIVPLNLRFLGLWPSLPKEPLIRLLVPVAAAGLALAVLAGLLLFSIRAGEYADIGVFRLKLVLIAAGTMSALFLHAQHGLWLRSAGEAKLKVHAALSLFCWLGALVCGRLIAFAGN